VTSLEPTQQLDSAREVAIEVLGQLAEFWGFTRTMGRIFGLIYLSPEPVTQAALAQQLKISPASVSLSINGLLRWGAVRKAYGQGSRKLRYEAETDFRKIVTSVLDSRERQTLEDAVDAVAHALDKLNARRGEAGEMDQATRFVLERLQHLESVYRLSFQLLKLLLDTGSVNVDAVAGMLGHTAMPKTR
jgi:DNA-binding transcriptional regulator GbsR (MarR family)